MFHDTMMIEEDYIEFDRGFPFWINRITLLPTPADEIYFHWHSFFEITLIESGSATYYVNQRLYRVSTGDLIIFNNMEPHGWQLDSSSMTVLFAVFPTDFISERIGDFDSTYLRSFIETGSNFTNKISREHAVTGQLRHLMREIHCEYTQQAIGYQLMVKATVLRLLTLFIRYFQDDSKPLEPLTEKRSAMTRLGSVFTHLYHHYPDKITLEEMARECFMSPTYFSSYFRKTTGTTFSDYLNGIRVRHASELLSTTARGVAEIAMDCGFNNMSNFYRIFKKLTGKNPGDLRTTKEDIP